MKYQSSSTYCVKSFLARLKFQRGGQNDRQEKNNMPPDLRSQGAKKLTALKINQCQFYILICTIRLITAYDDFHSSDLSNFEINNLYRIQQSTKCL